MFGLPGFLFTCVLTLTLTSCHLCLFLSGVSGLLMIGIIVAIMNALIKEDSVTWLGEAGTRLLQLRDVRTAIAVRKV